MYDILNFNWGGNSGADYLNALLYSLGTLIVLKIFKTIIIARLHKIADKTKSDFDDVLVDILNNLKPPFYLLVAVYVGARMLEMPELIWQVIKICLMVAVAYEVVRALSSMVDFAVYKMMLKQKEGETAEDSLPPENAGAIETIATILKVVFWLLAVILILSNLGVNVSSVIAGLGIGGIAIALALQNVLSDIFASFSIIVDKPFKAGDFIVIGSDMGTVEKIGIKSTRIRTLQGEELVVSNKELTTERVHNFKRMKKRRVVFDLGVTYETSQKKLEMVPKIIQAEVEKIDAAEFDRCHFKSFGDYNLIFESVYYINSADYIEYMDVRQKINLAVFEAFKKEGIDFAYPTQVEYQKELNGK